MGTHALPHQGLGVAQYCWATSPLRRYVDLVNQRQILAVASGATAPYAAGDSDLFAVISSFDARYAAYADFQQRMERYWCLRWIGQLASSRLEAVVVRDELVRLAQAPLYFRMPELPALGLAPGRRIVVDVLARDDVDLSLSARFIEVAAVQSAADALLAQDVIVEDGTPPDEGLEQPAAAAEDAESGAAHGPNGEREGDGGEAVSVVL
jgi:exoribonuclease-2